MQADAVKERAAERRSIPPLGLGASFMLFGGAGLLFFVATHGLIPALAARSSIEPVLLWFAVGGVGVFAPLILVGCMLLAREHAFAQPGVWRDRLRFRPLSRADLLASAVGLALIALLSGASLAAAKLAWGEVHMHPSFMALEPLAPGRYWILGVWLPFWLLNILGEEFLWRGVVQPRQEVAFGKWAWLVNAAGWGLFHVALGPGVMLALWPALFVVPYAVQRRRNSWVGVVIHAGLNGPGFIAVAFGLV